MGGNLRKKKREKEKEREKKGARIGVVPRELLALKRTPYQFTA